MDWMTGFPNFQSSQSIVNDTNDDVAYVNRVNQINWVSKRKGCSQKFHHMVGHHDQMD